jgi:hypothetical protein
LLIAECGWKEKNPKSEIRNPKSKMGRPMLFQGNALAFGPQAFFFPERKESEGDKRRWCFDFVFRFRYNSS